MMYENIEPENCNPPGTFLSTVPHPIKDKTIEKAVITEHRFAFFFWLKWFHLLGESSEPPALVTIDWHRDLAPPTSHQKDALEHLDQANLSDMANFIWARFDQTNDGHILSAAWLNLIGDIILLQHTSGDQQSSFKDRYNNEHRILEFKSYERFEKYLTKREDKHLFLDIDLDYFIHGRGNMLDAGAYKRYSDEEIKGVINLQNYAFQYMLPRLEGLTIAQEPSYCGGIANSAHIMQVVDNQLFDENNEWRF